MKLARLLSAPLAALSACGAPEAPPLAQAPDPLQVEPLLPLATPTPDLRTALPEPEFVPPVLAGMTALEDESPEPHVVEVTLSAGVLTREIVTDVTADIYAFNGQWPGPVIQAKVGDEVIVHFRNDLPEPTTIHWHGLRISDQMDGSPRIQDPVPPGGEFTYRFVVPDAGTFWYHPHVRANEQVEKGLYGMFVVHDPKDPVVNRERAFAVDDILLSRSSLAAFLQNHMEAMHGRFGNVLLTNGSGDTLTDRVTRGSVERWRIVNTANARTMELTVDGASWRVIGTDGGLVAEPYTPARVVISPGQRYDLEVRFDTTTTATLTSHVLTQDRAGNVIEVGIPLATYEVEASNGDAPTPAWHAPERPHREPTRDLTVTLDGVSTATGLEWRINGVAHADAPIFEAMTGEAVRLRFVNRAGPEHPFHLHGQFFEIVPDGSEATAFVGLKDVVLVPGNTSLEVVAYLDNPGRWMAHCHILEHAELGMMAEFVVGDGEGSPHGH